MFLSSVPLLPPVWSRDVNFSKFFRGRAGHGGKVDFRHVAEQGGENSLCGGNPPQTKSVAEFCHGGKISPWRKIAVAEKNRHGGKNRRGGRSPWRKKIAVAEFRHGGKISPSRKIAMAEKFFCIRRVQSVHFSSYSRSEFVTAAKWQGRCPGNESW